MISLGEFRTDIFVVGKMSYKNQICTKKHWADLEQS